jgi:uncharacterized protein (TIGR03067 family)
MTGNFRMRVVLSVLLAAAPALLLAEDKKEPKSPTDYEQLQGTWKLVSIERRGTHLKGDIGKTLTFDGDKLILQGLENCKLILRLNPAKNPKEFDVLVGRLLLSKGIYELDGDTLTWCCGNSERPKKFSGGSDQSLLTAKRDEVAASATAAHAQGGRMDTMGDIGVDWQFTMTVVVLGMSYDPTYLLMILQKELNLTDAQISKVEDMMDDVVDEMATGKIQDRAADNRKKIADLLEKPQMERFEEINLQVVTEHGGVDLVLLLLRDDMAEKVGLSADQKKKLDDLVKPKEPTEVLANSWGLWAFSGRREEWEKKREEMTAKTYAILTAEQKEKIEKLEGKKFDETAVDFTQLKFGLAQGTSRLPGGQSAANFQGSNESTSGLPMGSNAGDRGANAEVNTPGARIAVDANRTGAGPGRSTQNATNHNNPDAWRIVRYNNEWWYWASGNYWMYYRDNHWSRYDQDTFRPLGN